MNILITGATGQVGWELTHAHWPSDWKISALDEIALDITNEAQIKKVFAEIKPDLVINPAAYTAVDKAEEETTLAFKVNRDGPALLATACSEKEIPLIHLSTDYIFDGNKSTPYTEEDQPNPINVYGQSKWQGEERVREILSHHIILRLSGVFSAHGNNFVKTILRLAQTRDSLNVVNDQMVGPTPAADIAAVIIKIATKIIHTDASPLWGTYHYTASDPTTWYNFARAIVEEAKKYQPVSVKTITPITSAEFKTLAKRAGYTVLNCDKIRQNFAIEQIPWRSGLNRIIRALVS